FLRFGRWRKGSFWHGVPFFKTGQFDLQSTVHLLLFDFLAIPSCTISAETLRVRPVTDHLRNMVTNAGLLKKFRLKQEVLLAHQKKTIAIGALLVIAMSGCRSIQPYIQTYTQMPATHYVFVMPEGRETLPCVKEFIAFKQEQGFMPEVLSFSMALSPDERCIFVQEQLAQRKPNGNSYAYVLFIATEEELPMGPWKFEGHDQTVVSDIPLLLGKAIIPEETIRDEDWSDAYSSKFPWIPGRIPFSDEDVLETIFSSTRQYFTQPETSKPHALLGAERFMCMSDFSLVMGRAKRAFIKQGWESILFAQDGPADVRVGKSKEDESVVRISARTAADPNIVVLYDVTIDKAFVRYWARHVPRVVYIGAHSCLFSADNNISIGRYLVSSYAINALSENLNPDRPAVLMTTGCSVGKPNNDLLKKLFSEKWICCFVGTSETIDPYPLWAGIGAEINIAKSMADGMSPGMALRATRDCYFDQSKRKLSSKKAWMIRRNLFSFVIYGDPSVTFPIP
ncbi:MAG: hypothetical protein JXR23_04675, partial [Pontiellaceae bacterium]|nr:hypothetical protein [Pontiellaceae bacterium]